MDSMVLKTQQWLNATYGTDTRFNLLTEDGITGWGTIYGLTRALQIELGITSTADNFGPSTIELFNSKYPNGIMQQAANDVYEDNVYAIIQGALWCKGYSTGASEITKHFYGGTGAAVINLKTDAGISAPTSTVTLNVMKALLSMNQYVRVSQGDHKIRVIQQDLNNNYESYIGLAPCDGLYSRDMNKAMIMVLQAIEGLSTTDATGNFGPTTKAKCPILPNGSNVTESNCENAIKLLRYALYCNGYDLDSFAGTWDDEIESVLASFQSDYALSVTCEGDLDTWMSLLISTGNPDRSALACDCATILNSAKASSLYAAGYRYVGRYLTGTVGSNYTPKNLTQEEMRAIFAAGLKIFAIYQDNNPSVSYFTRAQGEVDASLAIAAAQSLGIPYHEVIYFAVDYDMMDYQITSNVIPYFEGIYSVMKSNRHPYRIGVYGSRNVCSRVSGKAVSSYVSDMSTGFSGNMGYPLPENWAFDQFNEYIFTSTDGSFGLDKDAVSGLYTGFNEIEDHSGDDVIEVPVEEIYLERFEYLLSLFGINASKDLKLGEEFTYNVGNLEIKYAASDTVSYARKGNCKYATINVSNGEVDASIVSETVNFYDQLSATAQAKIDDDGTLQYAVSLEKEIENGSIQYGIGINSEGDLFVDYLIEEVLWTVEEEGQTIEYKLYSNITITVKNHEDYGAEYAYVLEKQPFLTENDVLVSGRLLSNSLVRAITIGAMVGIIIFILFNLLIPA